MSLAHHLPPPMTVAEFLAWEETQELRWEFDGTAPVATTGGTEAHELIEANLLVSLTTRLRGKPCRAYGSNLKIQVAGSIRYPDAFIACGPANLRGTVRDDPVIVFEILSRSTARIDRVEKMREYWDAPSIRRYVLIEQEGISATSYIRQDGRWTGKVLWAGDMLDLPEAGIAVPLEDLYEGLDPAALRSSFSSATPET
jgi:Uma2 family endonuclease